MKIPKAHSIQDRGLGNLSSDLGLFSFILGGLLSAILIEHRILAHEI